MIDIPPQKTYDECAYCSSKDTIPGYAECYDCDRANSSNGKAMVSFEKEAREIAELNSRKTS